LSNEIPSGKLATPIPNNQLPIIHCQLSIVNYQLPQLPKNIHLDFPQKQKIPSGIQKRSAFCALAFKTNLSLSDGKPFRVGFGTLHIFLEQIHTGSVGCQGFIGPIPSTFLDRIAFKRTDAKISRIFRIARICRILF
jgi:hypothetical protein